MTGNKKQFDYIIVGAGCAGLSLAMHMMKSSAFTQSQILIIDKAPKQVNDRTWCFWEQENGLFEPIVHRQWEELAFHAPNWSANFSIDPYRYKMIRGLDFYNYCFRELAGYGNVRICFDKVEGVFSNEDETGVLVNGEKIFCDYVFNSVLFSRPKLRTNDYWLWQHFKGWMIEIEEDRFNKTTATLMDFSVDQDVGTAFCYVLPVSGRRALVEYTVFSKELLEAEQYNRRLESYIREQLKIDHYRMAAEEFGMIPMTNYRFAARQHNIVNIGTAGGQTKGSSGYTFNFIQKHSQAIVEALIKTGLPFVRKDPARFRFYDSVLLRILANNRLPGATIFY